MLFTKKHKLHKELKSLKTHAKHTLLVDDDILSDKQKEVLRKIEKACDNCDRNSAEAMQKLIDENTNSYRKILPPLKNAWIREYLDILAVAVAVAFGIRGLFLQPFQIPTSSMQPTLFGIHYIAKEGQTNPLLGKLSAPLDYLLFACERAKLTIKKDGVLEDNNSYGVFQQTTRYGFFSYTSFNIGGVNYSLPGLPRKVNEYSSLADNFTRDGNVDGRITYKVGQKLCDGWLSSGDHLFVDRFSHLLLGFKRGDIVVFNTEGIYYNGRSLAKNGYYYIKRLVGLPGDTLKIKNKMLYVRSKGATTFTLISELSEKFKKLYSNKGGYHGHWNVPTENDLSEEGFTVPVDSYFMMGDNSRNSLDSRYWSTVPRRNIVGKSLFVFWPISRRWGLTDRAAPVPISTNPSTLKSMHLQ